MSIGKNFPDSKILEATDSDSCFSPAAGYAPFVSGVVYLQDGECALGLASIEELLQGNQSITLNKSGNIYFAGVLPACVPPCIGSSLSNAGFLNINTSVLGGLRQMSSAIS